MNPSARALVNYWWLVVAGLVVGALAAVIVVSQQSSKKYTAEAKLFVNAPNDPYLRTQERTVTPQAPKLHAVRTVVPGTNGARPRSSGRSRSRRRSRTRRPTPTRS